jgi:hypothetical protein
LPRVGESQAKARGAPSSVRCGKSRPGLPRPVAAPESSACGGESNGPRRRSLEQASLGHNANAASVHYATQPVLIGAGLFSAREKPRRSGAEVFRICSAAESSAAARQRQLNWLVSRKRVFAFCYESIFWPAAHATSRHGRRTLSLRRHRPERAGLVRRRCARVHLVNRAGRIPLAAAALTVRRKKAPRRSGA